MRTTTVCKHFEWERRHCADWYTAAMAPVHVLEWRVQGRHKGKQGWVEANMTKYDHACHP